MRYVFELIENNKVVSEITVYPKDNTQGRAEKLAQKYISPNQTLRQKV
jgi:hypothetical protein